MTLGDTAIRKKLCAEHTPRKTKTKGDAQSSLHALLPSVTIPLLDTIRFTSAIARLREGRFGQTAQGLLLPWCGVWVPGRLYLLTSLLSQVRSLKYSDEAGPWHWKRNASDSPSTTRSARENSPSSTGCPRHVPVPTHLSGKSFRGCRVCPERTRKFLWRSSCHLACHAKRLGNVLLGE